MMTWIRRMIYRMGMRPKRGNIFYSPTLHYNNAFKRAIKSFDDGVVDAAVQRERQSLYLMMKYCVFCGNDLKPINEVKLEVKECPRGCGSAFADIDTDGSPFVAFDR